MKKQKKVLSIAIIFMVAMMGVVYASYSVVTMKVNTTAYASASIFDVGFANIAPVLVEKTNDNIIVNTETPEEGTKDLTISVSGLKQPGDRVVLNYFIINNGDINASDVTVRSGPAIEGNGDWPIEFSSPGSSWISDDGVFKFGAYPLFDGEYASDEFWKSNPNGTAPLETGKKGVIMVEVELLKRVETDTNCSSTIKLIAMPDGADIGTVQ